MSSPADEHVYFAPEPEFREAVARLFERVRAELQGLIPRADVQHVGSTAIPGSLTKGDLDVQVRVAGSDYAEARERLVARYAINTGGFVSPDAVSFEDYATTPSLGVHLTVIGGTADIQCRFRDLLIAEPALREEYDRLKACFHGKRMDDYRNAKAEFVERVLAARRPS